MGRKNLSYDIPVVVVVVGSWDGVCYGVSDTLAWFWYTRYMAYGDQNPITSYFVILDEEITLYC